MDPGPSPADPFPQPGPLFPSSEPRPVRPRPLRIRDVVLLPQDLPPDPQEWIGVDLNESGVNFLKRLAKGSSGVVDEDTGCLEGNPTKNTVEWTFESKGFGNGSGKEDGIPLFGRPNGPRPPKTPLRPEFTTLTLYPCSTSGVRRRSSRSTVREGVSPVGSIVSWFSERRLGQIKDFIEK